MAKFHLHRVPNLQRGCEVAVRLSLIALARRAEQHRAKSPKFEPLWAIDDKLPMDDIVKTLANADVADRVFCHDLLLCPTHDLLDEDPVADRLAVTLMPALGQAEVTFPQKLRALPIMVNKQPPTKGGVARAPVDRSPDVFCGLITRGVYFNGVPDPGTFAGMSIGVEYFLAEHKCVAMHNNHGPKYKSSRTWSRPTTANAELVVGLCADNVVLSEDDIRAPDHPLNYLLNAQSVAIIQVS